MKSPLSCEPRSGHREQPRYVLLCTAPGVCSPPAERIPLRTFLGDLEMKDGSGNDAGRCPMLFRMRKRITARYELLSFCLPGLSKAKLGSRPRKLAPNRLPTNPAPSMAGY